MKLAAFGSGNFKRALLVNNLYTYISFHIVNQRLQRTVLLWLKEHNHVFAHAQKFDFCLGGQEFKDARIDIELSQIRLHRTQLTLALPLNF